MKEMHSSGELKFLLKAALDPSSYAVFDYDGEFDGDDDDGCGDDDDDDDDDDNDDDDDYDKTTARR